MDKKTRPKLNKGKIFNRKISKKHGIAIGMLICFLVIGLIYLGINNSDGSGLFSDEMESNSDLSDVVSELTSARESLNELHDIINTSFETLNNSESAENIPQIGADVMSLMEKMETLKYVIAKSDHDIFKVLAVLQELNVEGNQYISEEINTAINELNEAFADIMNKYDTVNAETKNLLAEIMKTSGGNHNQLIQNLSEISARFEAINNSTKAEMLLSIANLKDYAALVSSQLSEQNRQTQNQITEFGIRNSELNLQAANLANLNHDTAIDLANLNRAELEAILVGIGFDLKDFAGKNQEYLVNFLMEVRASSEKLAAENHDVLIKKVTDLGIGLGDDLEFTKEELVFLITAFEANSNKLIEDSFAQLGKDLAGYNFDSTVLANKNKEELRLILLQLGWDADITDKNQQELRELLLGLGVNAEDLNDKSNEELIKLLSDLGFNMETAINEYMAALKAEIDKVSGGVLNLSNKTVTQLEQILNTYGDGNKAVIDEMTDKLLKMNLDFKVHAESVASKNQNEMKSIVQDFSASIHSRVTSDINSLKNNYLAGEFSNMSSEFSNIVTIMTGEGGLGDDMAANFTYTNSLVNNKFSNLYTELAGNGGTAEGMFPQTIRLINANVSDRADSLDNSIDFKFSSQNDYLNAQFDLLFQRVSSGKTSLATALLTDASVVERPAGNIYEYGAVNIPFAAFADAINAGDAAVLNGKTALFNAMNHAINRPVAERPVLSGTAHSHNFSDYAAQITAGDLAVADGKSRIINALRGNSRIIAGSVSNSSTFSQIENAINGITCSNINCGVNPNVAYTRHYHITSGSVPESSDVLSQAAGANLPADTLNATTRATQGGCFQTGILHVHTGSSGSGCYQGAYQSHTHSGCSQSQGGPICKCTGGGARVIRGGMAFCGACDHAWHVNDWDTSNTISSGLCFSLGMSSGGYTCGNQPLNSNRALNCGRTGLFDYYGINCKRTWGEITKAEISYPAQ